MVRQSRDRVPPARIKFIEKALIFLNIIMPIVHVTASQGQLFRSFCQLFRQTVTSRIQSHNGDKCTPKCLIHIFGALFIAHKTVKYKKCTVVHALMHNKTEVHNTTLYTNFCALFVPHNAIQYKTCTSVLNSACSARSAH